MSIVNIQTVGDAITLDVTETNVVINCTGKGQLVGFAVGAVALTATTATIKLGIGGTDYPIRKAADSADYSINVATSKFIILPPEVIYATTGQKVTIVMGSAQATAATTITPIFRPVS